MAYMRPFTPDTPIAPWGSYGRAIAPQIQFGNPSGWMTPAPSFGAPGPAQSPIPAGFRFTPTPASSTSGGSSGSNLSSWLGPAIAGLGLLGGAGGTSGLLSTVGSALADAAGVSGSGLLKNVGQWLGVTPAGAAPLAADAAAGGAGAAGAAAATGALGSSAGLGLAAPELGSAGLLGGIGPGDAALLAELAAPAAEGVTTGTAAGTAGGIAAESAAPATAALGAGAGEALGGALGAYGGDAAVSGGLLGGSLYGGAEAGAMGPALASASPLAGAAAFALPLAIAAAGWLSQPDTSATGGVVNLGVGPDGRAAILGGSAKGMDLPNSAVQRQLDALNAWLPTQGISLRPDWTYNMVVGSGTEHDPLSSSLWDRLGFQAGDAFTANDPAKQEALGRFYRGWGDFAQAFGGGPAGAQYDPQIGYRLSPEDSRAVFGDGFLPLFGGAAGGWSDRWADLAAREAARTRGIASESGGGDLHPRADALGLPVGFLEMFDAGADPRTLPTTISTPAMNDAYLANLRGEAAFDPYQFANSAPAWQSADPALLAQAQADADAAEAARLKAEQDAFLYGNWGSGN